MAKQAATPAKKAAAAQTTVTLKQIAADLADKHEMTKKQAEAVLSDLVATTTRHLKKGDRIRLTGLGILQVRKRAARTAAACSFRQKRLAGQADHAAVAAQSQ